MTDLQALLDRVELASGPDRYIDFWATVLLWEPDPADDLVAISQDVDLVGIDEMWVAMAFSGSLDAALALCERVLPGWFVHAINQTDRGDWYVTLTLGPPSLAAVHVQSRTLRTPALALLAALLRALLAQQEHTKG